MANIDKEEKHLSTANQGQLLVVSKQAVRRLSQSMTMDEKDLLLRFRANLVIDNVAESESNWKQIEILGMFLTGELGAFVFEAVAPCVRCAIINIDQKSGQKSLNPLQALMRINSKKTEFGVLVYLSTRPTNPAANIQGGCVANILCESVIAN